MPRYYRKRTKRYGRRYSNNRSYRKRFSRRGSYRNKGPNRTYYFKRSCQFPNYTIPTPASETLSYYQFKLTDLPDYSDFTSLYDQYQIAAVKMSFIPIVNAVQSSISSTGTTGALYNYYRSYTAIDYNNTAPLASVDKMREYQTFKWKPVTKIHSRYIKPKLTLQNNALPYNPSKNTWLDCSSAFDPSQAPYSGIHFGVDAVPNLPAGTELYAVECKYYIKFRTVV